MRCISVLRDHNFDFRQLIYNDSMTVIENEQVKKYRIYSSFKTYLVFSGKLGRFLIKIDMSKNESFFKTSSSNEGEVL